MSKIKSPTKEINRKTLYFISKTKPYQRLNQLIRNFKSRKTLICANTIIIAQQLTEINIINEYFFKGSMIKAFHVVLIQS